jgi:hypothetical protein
MKKRIKGSKMQEFNVMLSTIYILLVMSFFFVLLIGIPYLKFIKKTPSFLNIKKVEKNTYILKIIEEWEDLKKDYFYISKKIHIFENSDLKVFKKDLIFEIETIRSIEDLISKMNKDNLKLLIEHEEIKNDKKMICLINQIKKNPIKYSKDKEMILLNKMKKNLIISM